MSTIAAVGAYNTYNYSPVYFSRHVDLSPVTPVESSPAVSAGRTSVLPYTSSVPASQMPEIREGADPTEMAVRGRIQYLTPDEVDQLIAQKNTDPGKEALSPAEVIEDSECQTCKERKYQDGSDDPGVSFQTPAHIDPDNAASVVRGHEMEHVVREQAKADREDREVVEQSVTLHTSICPECGVAYISGGTTRTVTRAKQESAPEQQAQNAPFEAVA